MLEFLIQSANTSRLFAGIMMLVLNIGSRFVMEDISKTHAEWFNNELLRQLVIFAICFVATRDVVTSLLLTSAFIIFTFGLFSIKSPMSIMKPHKPVLPSPPHGDPFGYLRISTPGLPPVLNPADNQNDPPIFTT